MDKVKVALAVLKRQHFWVLCGLTVLLSLAAWFKATGDLAKQFDDRTKKLKSAFDGIQQIAIEPNHPNEAFIEEVKKKHGGLREKVTSARKQLYKQQREANRLPIIIPVDSEKREEQQKGFEQEFENFWLPIEQMIANTKEMERRYLELYQNHIVNHLPRIYAGLGPVPPPKLPERFVTNLAPRTLPVMLAQEDLWVYEALLRIIENTNNNDPKKPIPESIKDANIKRILAMEIGKEAAATWASSAQPICLLPAAAPAESAEAAPSGGSESDGAPTTEAPPPISPDLLKELAGRYVDDKGNPVSDPTHQPYKEFRMVPVVIRVLVEQKALPRLLAECANSSMPIQVRTVRNLLKPGNPWDFRSSSGEGGVVTGGNESGGAPA